MRLKGPARDMVAILPRITPRSCQIPPPLHHHLPRAAYHPNHADPPSYRSSPSHMPCGIYLVLEEVLLYSFDFSACWNEYTPSTEPIYERWTDRYNKHEINDSVKRLLLEDGKGTFSHVSNARDVGSIAGRLPLAHELSGRISDLLFTGSNLLRETLNRVEQKHHHVSYGSEDCIYRSSCVVLLGLCEGKVACSPGMSDAAIGVVVLLITSYQTQHLGPPNLCLLAVLVVSQLRLAPAWPGTLH
jgi:hypothetical protein